MIINTALIMALICILLLCVLIIVLAKRVEALKEFSEVNEILIRGNSTSIRNLEKASSEQAGLSQQSANQIEALAGFVEQNRDLMLKNANCIYGAFEYLNRDPSFTDFVNGKVMELMSNPNFNMDKYKQKEDNDGDA